MSCSCSDVKKAHNGKYYRSNEELNDLHTKAHDNVRCNNVTAKYAFLETSETLVNKALYPHATRTQDNECTGCKETERVMSLAKKTFNLKNKTHLTTHLGVRLSSQPIKDYRATITHDQQEFTSTERFAHNSPICNESPTSSFNRYADTVTMMRKVEAEDMSSDYYTGRVDTLAKATEQAKFLFLSEFTSNKKGIKEENGSYTFTFSIQSLLAMGLLGKPGNEDNNFHAAKKAYEELLKQGPIEIPDPNNSNNKLRVKMEPLPIAGTSYNWTNTMAKILPESLHGLQKSKQRNSNETDKALEEYYNNNKNDFTSNAKTIKHTFALLKNTELKDFQEVMCRSYLCHLLNIPQVVHCKSSVDRTSLAGALITAMKQWIRSENTVPENIYDLAGKEEFKELFACNLIKGLKITEIARGESGFKWNTKPLGGLLSSPSLLDLLPKNYLEENKQYKRNVKIAKVASGIFLAGVVTGVVFALISFPLITSIALACLLGVGYVSSLQNMPKPIRYAGGLLSALIVVPSKLLWNANKFFHERKVNHDFNEEFLPKKKALKVDNSEEEIELTPLLSKKTN